MPATNLMSGISQMTTPKRGSMPAITNWKVESFSNCSVLSGLKPRLMSAELLLVSC